MFCSSCGKDVPDNSAYCPHCGKAVHVGAPTSKSTRRTRGLIIVAIAALTALVTLWIASGEFSDSPPQQATNVSPAAPPLRPVAEKLFSGQMIVRAGNYIVNKFTVVPTMHDVRVVGSFHASGGTGHDIQEVMAEESEFENWVNGHEARVLYSTEKITNGKIEIDVRQPGTYCLAFSNTFSLMADKDVFAEVELRYLSPE